MHRSGYTLPMWLILLSVSAFACPEADEAFIDDWAGVDTLSYCVGSYDFADGTLEEKVADAVAIWDGFGPCDTRTLVYTGPCEEAEGVPVTFTASHDLENGVLAGRRTFRSGDEVIRTEWLFNADMEWATAADVALGTCEGRPVIETLLRHEVGHLLGLGDVCNESRPCTDEESASLMSWSSPPPCTMPDPGPLESEQMLSDLGPDILPLCTGEGDLLVLPADASPRLNCAVDLDGLDADVSWSIGTQTAEGASVSLSIPAGLSDVEVCVEGQADNCSEPIAVCECWPTQVLGCPMPEAVFTAEPREPSRIELHNRSGYIDPDCRPEVLWEVFDGDKLIAEDQTWDASDIELPEDGRYRVNLTLTSVGGSSSAGTDVVVGNSGCGCASNGAGWSWAWVLVLLGCLRRR